MSVISPPGYLHNLGTHTAQIDRIAAVAAGLMPDGAGLTWRGAVRQIDDMKVTQNGTPNMSVNVAAGLAFVKGTENTFQGLYSVPNDGPVNLVIAAAHATLARNDLIICRIRDAFYSGATNTATLEVVTGTAAASPSDPTVPANSLIIGRVRVAAAASSIVTGAIDQLAPVTAALGGMIPCTSTSRPTAVKSTLIYETDTGNIMVYDGAIWQVVMKPFFDDQQFIVKNTDESVTSSVVMQNDNELFFSVVSGAKYLFEFVLNTTAGSSAVDGQATLVVPSGTLSAVCLAMDPAVSAGTIGSGEFRSFTAGGQILQFGTSATGTGVRIKGTFIATANGVVQLQWAQLASSATALTVRAGSTVEARRVG
jgi:hypothetical protein